MRTSLLFLLLASAAVPAFAAADDDDRFARRESARAARAERAEARPAPAEPRGERAGSPLRDAVRERVMESRQSGAQVEPAGDRPAVRDAVRERVMESRRPPSDVQVEPAGDRPALREAIRERAFESRRPPRAVEVETVRPTLERRREGVVPRVRESRGPRIVEVNSSGSAIEPSDAPDSVREWRRAERDGARTPALVEQRSDTGWEPLRRHRDQTVDGVTERVAPVVSRVPREGTQPPLRAMADRSTTTAHRWRGHWRRDWRHDRRYDWRSHRRRHRSLFHFGFYFDPFGWSYRPYSIGWRLWPHYYRSSYWLSDPWAYRLPYAPPGYRWIRYYDDALLVDTFDGTVVDVIRDFFW
jgi:Ni/Co efflux regulator RcnB